MSELLYSLPTWDLHNLGSLFKPDFNPGIYIHTYIHILYICIYIYMLFISLSAILYISLYRRACSYLRLCDEKYRSEMCVINFPTKKEVCYKLQMHVDT